MLSHMFFILSSALNSLHPILDTRVCISLCRHMTNTYNKYTIVILHSTCWCVKMWERKCLRDYFRNAVHIRLCRTSLFMCHNTRRSSLNCTFSSLKIPLHSLLSFKGFKWRVIKKMFASQTDGLDETYSDL